MQHPHTRTPHSSQIRRVARTLEVLHQALERLLGDIVRDEGDGASSSSCAGKLGVEIVRCSGGEGEDVLEGRVGDAEGAEVGVVLCDQSLSVDRVNGQGADETNVSKPSASDEEEKGKGRERTSSAWINSSLPISASLRHRFASSEMAWMASSRGSMTSGSLARRAPTPATRDLVSRPTRESVMRNLTDAKLD